MTFQVISATNIVVFSMIKNTSRLKIRKLEIGTILIYNLKIQHSRFIWFRSRQLNNSQPRRKTEVLKGISFFSLPIINGI